MTASPSCEAITFRSWCPQGVATSVCDALLFTAVRRHDDHSGGLGGLPGDPNPGGTGNAGAKETARGATLSSRHYDFFEDEPGYSDSEATALVSDSGRSDDYYDDLGGRGREIRWNAGVDFALLIARLWLGGVFILHGAQKLFGVLGGPGPDGFAQSLQQMGYQQSVVLSLVTGGTELGAGALLVLGLFTPLAAAGIAGVMGNAIAMNITGPFFAMEGGYEFEATLLVFALFLMFAGPGRVALDNGRSWFFRPVISGTVCLLVAAGSAAAVFFLLR